MTWLTWRQHRWEGAVALVLLLAFGGAVVALTVAGSGLLSEVARNCQPDSHGAVSNACGSVQSQFNDNFQPRWWWIVVVGTVAPALVGMFVGAPMIAREVENGTQLLVWTQGITRRRWFLSRCALVAGGGTLGATALAAAAQGWFNMQHAVASPLSVTQWDGFEIGAPVVIAYTLFAFALGVAAGAVVRRTVPAMAATLVTFIATRVAIALIARPNYVTPLTQRGSVAGESYAFGPGGAGAANAWSVGPTVLYNPAGKPIPFGFCIGSGPGCFTHVTAVQQYQPGDRFWLFQGIEAAIFIVLAFALFAFAYRLVMRIR
jgi:hypothetical protein